MPPSAKNELRQWALNHMRAMTPENVAERSRRVMENLKKTPEFARARHIFTCLSFGHEVDTWSLVNELQADPERKLYVPRIAGDGTLRVHPYPCQLRTLRMGLQQPAAGQPEVPPEEVNARLDAGLILGVAFERARGCRLGYGRGFFDRFLAGKTFLTIGLSFESLLLDRLPADPHDVPMRMMVTEEQVCRYPK